MSDRGILLLYRRLTLIVFVTATPAVQQELRQSDIRIPMPSSFHIVDKTSETYQRLLHFLVAVKPDFFTRPDIRRPAIRQPLRRFIKSPVPAPGQGIVIDR